MKDELHGRLVLVHPKLTNDPANKQNHIGRISDHDLINDNIIVDFEDGEFGVYAADALLVLVFPGELHQMFIANTFIEPSPDLEALIKIDRLTMEDSPRHQQKALELARAHTDIQPLCLDTLENVLAINKNQYPER